MNLRLKIFLSIMALSGLTFTICQNLPIKIDKDLDHINLNEINKLMIMAHPDDETIWGGAALIKDNYLVVCITCGSKKNRAKEFKKSMTISNSKYIMLGYPDKKNGVRDDWSKWYKDINDDLKKIIEYKNWDLIVTHNPDGEYGHEHHKMTSELVTKIYNQKEKLYYFGKYYRPSKIKDAANDLLEIDNKDINIKKNKMIKAYKTQRFIKKRFSHMFKYENWIKASDWGKNTDL